MDSHPANRDQRSDSALLLAHVAGDPQAFTELINRHHRYLYRLARRSTRTAEEAQDALQDALLAAYRNAASFRHDAAVVSWLHRIVVNACMDHLRRTKNYPMTVQLDSSHPAVDHTGQTDTALIVRAALMQLPVDQRAAVVAVDMQGYSIADTAALLGVAQGTVKSRRARARTRLAAILYQLKPGTSPAPGI